MLDGIDLASSSETVRTLAEATLALVLFCDASRIDLGQLRREVGVPLRLLGIGLPLTIAAGRGRRRGDLRRADRQEAVILAVVLAPTDAALGQAVVTEPRVRSGSARGSTSRAGSTTGSACRCCSRRSRRPTWSRRSPTAAAPATLLLEEIGYGVVGGVVGGLLVAAIVSTPAAGT